MIDGAHKSDQANGYHNGTDKSKNLSDDLIAKGLA